jgi:predicted transcriptional regulator
MPKPRLFDEPLQHFTLRLPPSWAKRLAEIARERRCDRSEIVREALEPVVSGAPGASD